MWQIMNGKNKILNSYERDQQLLIICHIKIMAKNNNGPTTTQKEK